MPDIPPTSAAALARETSYTAEQWQHALNVLGSHTTELLPTVKDYAARLRLVPFAAALVVLDAVGEEPSRA